MRLALLWRRRVCGTLTRHEASYMHSFAYSDGWAILKDHGSVTRALVFIDGERNKAITYGCGDVFTFDRPNAR
jgi:hypothetical protein